MSRQRMTTNREPHPSTESVELKTANMAPGALFVPELTGCSSTADNHDSADGQGHG
jgi:hypothetical protein